tara:strand:- start:425 stop:1582 length:1158 start_codon:yes stop_codon:yes gene_type:complete
MWFGDDKSKLEQVLEQAQNLSTMNHLSTIYDYNTRQGFIELQENYIKGRFRDGSWKYDIDAYEAAKQAHKVFFGDKYTLETGNRINFSVNTQLYDRYDIDPDLALNGANLIIGTMDQMNSEGNQFEWGIFKSIGEDFQKAMPEEALKKAESKLEGIRLMHGQDTAEFLEREITQDIIEGNAENLYRSLIHSSDGQGYQIGIFYVPEGFSKKDAMLIGAMLDGNKYKRISEEELFAASIEDHLYDYVSEGWSVGSTHFEIDHEEVKRLHKYGLNIDENQEGHWKRDRVSGWELIRVFQDMGELEFRWAIKPLHDLLEKKAVQKFGKNYNSETQHLTESETREVLEIYMDRFDRFYKSTYIPDAIRPFVRNIQNSLDVGGWSEKEWK